MPITVQWPMYLSLIVLGNTKFISVNYYALVLSHYIGVIVYWSYHILRNMIYFFNSDKLARYKLLKKESTNIKDNISYLSLTYFFIIICSLFVLYEICKRPRITYAISEKESTIMSAVLPFFFKFVQSPFRPNSPRKKEDKICSYILI